MIEVKVKMVGLDPRGEQRVVILEEVGGDRYLSMSVRPWEAEAIAAQMERDGCHEPPTTHDLVLAIVARFGGRLRRAILTDVRHETYHAILELDGAPDASPLPCRASDAVALAMRAAIPIYVTPGVAHMAMRRISRHPRPPDHPPTAG